jgi:hypothetical protein
MDDYRKSAVNLLLRGGLRQTRNELMFSTNQSPLHIQLSHSVNVREAGTG